MPGGDGGDSHDAGAGPPPRGAGALSLAAVLSYILSRSVGLPLISDDIGDWLGALGIAAAACETAALAICSSVLWRPRADRHRPALA